MTPNFCFSPRLSLYWLTEQLSKHTRKVFRIVGEDSVKKKFLEGDNVPTPLNFQTEKMKSRLERRKNEEKLLDCVLILILGTKIFKLASQ